MDYKIDPTKPLFLSELVLDLRHREVWRLLGDSYGLHRRILSAFPEKSEGGCGRVLFRVESGKGEAKVLVQSCVEPNWSSLPNGMCELVRGPREWKPFTAEGAPVFGNGARFRYRLRANPTFRSRELEAKFEKDIEKKNRNRFACLTRLKQAEWLERQGSVHGFSLPPVPSGDDWLDPFADEPEEGRRETHLDMRITPLNLTGNKPGREGQPGHRLTHIGVDFEGVLTVTDPDRFAHAIVSGIGPAKAFGFGLLSLARAA